MARSHNLQVKTDQTQPGGRGFESLLEQNTG